MASTFPTNNRTPPPPKEIELMPDSGGTLALVPTNGDALAVSTGLRLPASAEATTKLAQFIETLATTLGYSLIKSGLTIERPYSLTAQGISFGIRNGETVGSVHFTSTPPCSPIKVIGFGATELNREVLDRVTCAIARTVQKEPTYASLLCVYVRTVK